MPNKQSGKDYFIPNPKDELKSIKQDKYTFGQQTNKLNEIKNAKPIFAFDFMSLNQTNFCFNSSLMKGQKEYVRLLEGFKKVSDKTYNTLSIDNTYHFHAVDFKDITITQSDFLKCLVKDTSKIDVNNAPTVYQFKLFQEARVFGFIYSGIFYLVFLDRNHDAYKRK
jgi:hypothetical protein